MPMWLSGGDALKRQLGELSVAKADKGYARSTEAHVLTEDLRK